MRLSSSRNIGDVLGDVLKFPDSLLPSMTGTTEGSPAKARALYRVLKFFTLDISKEHLMYMMKESVCSGGWT